MGQLAVNTLRLFILRDVRCLEVPVRYSSKYIPIFFSYSSPSFPETLRTFYSWWFVYSVARCSSQIPS